MSPIATVSEYEGSIIHGHYDKAGWREQNAKKQ